MNEQLDFEMGTLGRVEIAPEVIQVIAGLSASQVNGVADLAGGMVEDLNQLLGRKNPRKGIRVNLGEKTIIEIGIIVQYGFHIPDVGREVQESVKSTVEMMTGLRVDQVIVRVDGVKMAATEKVSVTEGNPRVR